jgi:hypothetical protein
LVCILAKSSALASKEVIVDASVVLNNFGLA